MQVLSKSTRIHLSSFLICKASLSTSARSVGEKRLPETWRNSCKGETHAESCRTKQYRGAGSWAVSHMTGYRPEPGSTKESLERGIGGRKPKSLMLFKHTDSIKCIRTWKRSFSFLTVAIFFLIMHVTPAPFLLRIRRDLSDQWKKSFTNLPCTIQQNKWQFYEQYHFLFLNVE